jgi:hypothetical protein
MDHYFYRQYNRTKPGNNLLSVLCSQATCILGGKKSSNQLCLDKVELIAKLLSVSVCTVVAHKVAGRDRQALAG